MRFLHWAFWRLYLTATGNMGWRRSAAASYYSFGSVTLFPEHWTRFLNLSIDTGSPGTGSVGVIMIHIGMFGFVNIMILTNPIFLIGLVEEKS